MALISLRDYHHKIEEWIDQGLYDQAILHCRHILNLYPKSIDTYRLLGKAYLEEQKFGDANDLFQRVLSSVPDDFVSHVGMSIIREDESNLNEAIWHMERAFEIQPSNNAIQGELRRLYGRRDGIEPARVNLNRSALARMYLKGNLHSQAIAEIRMALAEDPQRPDLELLLAKAYFETHQIPEAKDVATQLLRKLPYCYEALFLLWKIMLAEGNETEAKRNQLKLAELNPYAAHLSESNDAIEMIPDNAVVLEQLESSAQGVSPTNFPEPDWAASLGVQIHSQEESPSEASLPEWMAEQSVPESSELSEETMADAELIFSPQETLPERGAGEDIPDWMRELGWEESQQPQEEGDEASDIPPFIEDSPEEELETGEIPDWLKAISPAAENELDQIESGPVESLPILEEIPPAEGDSFATWLAGLEGGETDETGVASEPQAEELPDWVNELNHKTHLTTEYITSEEGLGEVEAIDTIGTEESPPSLEKSEISSLPMPSTEEELPAWLTEEEPLEKATELPDWLFSDSEEEAETILPFTEPPLSEVDTKPVKIAPQQEAKPQQPFPPQAEDEAFAWLEALAARQGAEEALLLSPEERKEEPPQWIREYLNSQPDQQPSETPAQEPISPEISPLPDLTIPIQERVAPEQLSLSEGETEGEALPEWLQAELEKEELLEQEPELEGEPSLPQWITAASSAETEEWVQEFTPETTEEIPTIEAPLPEVPTTTDEETSLLEVPAGDHLTTTIDEIPIPDFVSGLEAEAIPSASETETPLSAERKEDSASGSEFIAEARRALAHGALDQALDKYQWLVKQKFDLDQIIQDLSNALYQYPMEVKMWMLLGDAYLRKDLLAEALEAYNKAEELIR